MATSLYMLVCQSGSVDKKSNQVSHFNVVEQLQLSAQKAPAGGIPIQIPLQLQIVSTWIRDADDRDRDTFEIEMSFQKTGKPKQYLHKGTFTFGESRNHRITAHLALVPSPDSQTGCYHFDSRIRKAGTKRWLRQRYTVPILVDIPPPTSSNGKTKRRPKKR